MQDLEAAESASLLEQPVGRANAEERLIAVET
jgi:hypothetical protein